MPIKMTTTDEEIARHIEQQVERATKAIVRLFAKVGEEAVNEARSSGRYKDQTGNLRSSIGYIVSVDGTIARMSSFKQEKGSAKEGVSNGRTYAKKVVHNYPKGIALIIVAGMNYAAYVNAKGLNVLDSAEMAVKSKVPQMLRQLGFNA